jgi:cyanophycin synthetase
MEFRKVLALRGPNIWANYPVLEAWVDLGALKDSPSDELPGFNERLTAWLPTMVEHRCSVGTRGGFFERLRRGTYQAHILEHVALELQTLAGTEVSFGRTRETSEGGVYKVALEYENEELGRACLEAARKLCLAAVHGRPYDVEGELRKLRKLAGRILPRPGVAAILRAARKRKIPVQRLDEQGLLQLGYGARQRRVLGPQTDRTGALAESIARDHELTRTLLRSAGVPAPDGRAVQGAEDAWAAAEELGWPVLLKPRYGHRRRGAAGNLRSREEVRAAYEAASRETSHVEVERCAAGADFRLLVVGDRVVAAARRDPDGGAVDVTDAVHPEVAGRAVEAARVIGLDVAGVDVVAADVGLPLEEQGGVVVGVNARPGLAMHLQPTAGTPRPVGEAIVDSLFPEGEDGRIPTVAVTGVNGKTTTTRLIAHVVGLTQRTVGMTCTEGVYVGGRCVEAGDCSGPASARSVLQNPRVEAAVLETARGGILRAGLGFDRCDVAVVTNIAEGDHLGIADIDTPEQLALVKRTIVEVVVPTGAAVLKADDPLVAAMASACRGAVVFFARDPDHPVLVRHREQNGRVAFARDGHLILAEGDQEIPLVSLDRVPLTHGGRIGFQVENALAAAAAAWSLGVPCERIRVGLETFCSGMSHAPGRFNLLEVNGATVIVDYGHNAPALAALVEAIGLFPHKRRTAVYSTAGDRRDCDLVRQGELLGDAFDRVILYEDHYLRGRKEGEIIALFRRGVAAGSRVQEVQEVRGWVKAMEAALDSVSPGELLLVQADVIEETVTFLTGYLSAGPGRREIDFRAAVANARAKAAGMRSVPVG